MPPPAAAPAPGAQPPSDQPPFPVPPQDPGSDSEQIVPHLSAAPSTVEAVPVEAVEARAATAPVKDPTPIALQVLEREDQRPVTGPLKKRIPLPVMAVFWVLSMFGGFAASVGLTKLYLVHKRQSQAMEFERESTAGLAASVELAVPAPSIAKGAASAPIEAAPVQAAAVRDLPASAASASAPSVSASPVNANGDLQAAGSPRIQEALPTGEATIRQVSTTSASPTKPVANTKPTLRTPPKPKKLDPNEARIRALEQRFNN